MSTKQKRAHAMAGASLTARPDSECDEMAVTALSMEEGARWSLATLCTKDEPDGSEVELSSFLVSQRSYLLL
jgi:hypothetical protein